VTLHVLVLAKSPRPGRVKTRLCPPCSPEQAAAVAAASLADTLEAVAACGATRRVVALDGPPGPWLPPGFSVIPQRGWDFNHRLANAWADTGGPGIQIGMDTPQVAAAELDVLLAAIDGGGPHRAVLGHALDGGWWVIGWRRADPRGVFRGVPMSVPTTGRAQETRLRALGFDVLRAAPRQDIDTVADLAAIARVAPHLRTAHLARRLGLERAEAAVA
jgi:uncharacterized protein